MPLNVVDSYSKHVGVIVGKFAGKYVVAVTEDYIGDYMDKFHEQIKGKAAQAWNCKNMFGKINEEKFEAYLKQWVPSVKEEFFSVGKSLSLYALNKEDLFQFGLVKAFPTNTYILTEGKFMDDHYNIKLGFGISRVPGLGLVKNFPALVGEITAIPEINCVNNSTNLKLHVGDTDIDLSLPGHIITQKEQEIALEIDLINQKVLKTYVNGIIYSF
ncbi:MAG: hypothetical protein SCK28_14020 [Bacillota bacterium]|nr:hypothetical protein [Bacillota bacterium]